MLNCLAPQLDDVVDLPPLARGEEGPLHEQVEGGAARVLAQEPPYLYRVEIAEADVA